MKLEVQGLGARHATARSGAADALVEIWQANAAGRYDARTTINAKGKIVSPGFATSSTAHTPSSPAWG